jgi:hypothetical protein
MPPGSAVAVPVLAVAVAFAALCLVDLARAGQVRYLPKWLWAVGHLCLGALGWPCLPDLREGPARGEHAAEGPRS